MNTSKFHLIFLLVFLWVFSGCTTPATAIPTPTEQATQLPTETLPPQTSTDFPTLTPTSTSAPPTPAPSPSPMPFELAALPLGEWVQLADMPTARSETAAVVSDGLIYVPGGVGNGLMDMALGYFVYPPLFSQAMEVYDPASNTWQKLARMPEPRHHLMTAALNGRIYVFGGGSLCEGVCPDPEAAWAYDIASDTWLDVAPMPEHRYAGAAVALDGFVYVIGGYGDHAADTLRYDPTTDTWVRLAPLNQPREHTAAVTLDGKLYVLGGRWALDMSSIEIYDPVTDTWTLGAPMKQPRAGHGAAVVGNQIYVGGGELIFSGGLESTVKTVEVYNPGTNSWIKIFDLPNGIHGVPAASVEGIFYLLGGSESAGGVANRGTVWAYRP